MEKIRVGLLGATGAVGQNYVRLLERHPWFDLVDVAASPRSAGKTYIESVRGRWLGDARIPSTVADLNVRDVNDFESIPQDVKLFFSATELHDKHATADFEFGYASRGFAVVSNSSANRWTADVPMLIPEINHAHLALIRHQQKIRHISGFVVTKPNCSIQSYLTVLHAIEAAGYAIKGAQVTTLQALSGAGYKGLTEPERRTTVVPYIGGEEEKTIGEPLKILGSLQSERISQREGLELAATCTRVPVVDGHTAVVQVNFEDAVPRVAEVSAILQKFTGLPQTLELPSAPQPAIHVRTEADRPQVAKDVNAGQGMAITVGRIQEDHFFDLKFVALSHNTIRGAAGGAILTAELLVKQGYLTSV